MLLRGQTHSHLLGLNVLLSDSEAMFLQSNESELGNFGEEAFDLSFSICFLTLLDLFVNCAIRP